MSDSARLLELLKARAVRAGDITLASGQSSSVYVDTKQASLTGEGHALVGRLYLEHFNNLEDKSAPFVACAGMSIGADPISSALSLTAHLAGRELPAIYVRKEPKGHGTGTHLEGVAHVERGPVLLVEDVVTTGGSSLKAIAHLRDGGFVVDQCVCIVDREAGGRENLKEAGVELTALFRLEELT